MDTLTNLKASGIRVIVFEDDSITTFCDGWPRNSLGRSQLCQTYDPLPRYDYALRQMS